MYLALGQYAHHLSHVLGTASISRFDDFLTLKNLFSRPETVYFVTFFVPLAISFLQEFQ